VGNRDAIGSHVRVEAGGVPRIRTNDGGSSFLGMNSKIMHFGLGQATAADKVIVTFPTGLKFEDRGLGLNQMLTFVEPVVTIGASRETVNINPGGTFQMTMSMENHSDQSQTHQRWIDFIKPDGTLKTVKSPTDVTLAAGQQASANVTFRTTPGTPPGIYSLVFRMGTHPDQIVHQDYVDVTIEAAYPLSRARAREAKRTRGTIVLH